MAANSTTKIVANLVADCSKFGGKFGNKFGANVSRKIGGKFHENFGKSSELGRSSLDSSASASYAFRKLLGPLLGSI